MNVIESSTSGLTGKIALLNSGDPKGLPVFAVHGWLDNAASFKPLCNELPEYCWTAIDLPGHGKSDYRPAGCVYHFTDYVADIYHTLDSLNCDRVSLVGHSLGAGILATFAAAFPDRVRNLVLIDGIGPISGEDDDTLVQLRKSMAFLTKNKNDGPRTYPSWEYLVNRRLEAGEIERHSVETLLERGSFEDEAGVTVLSDGRLKQHSPIYMSQDKVLSILSGIECPVLLIVAEQGLIATRQSTEDRIARIANVETVRVPGAHHLHLDDPTSVSGHIRRFFEENQL